MANIITYKDKVDLVLDTSIAEEYKFSASDANQLKTGINNIVKINKIDLLAYDGRKDIVINYAKLYVDATRRRCEMLFDISAANINAPFSAITHHHILDIPLEYIPELPTIYGWGTAGASGFVQVRVDSSTKLIGVWMLNSALTVRGGAIWHY